MQRYALWVCLLVMIPFSAAHTTEKWQLPQDMVWHTPDQTCTPSRNSAAFFKGCYFGKSGIAQNSGAAFFRICSSIQDIQPFLTVDYDKGTFRFFLGEDGRYRDGKLENESIDPAKYFKDYRDSKPCPAPKTL